MSKFTDYDQVDGFDNAGGDDDNFLSASGRSRKAARQAVKAAHKAEKDKRKSEHKASKDARKTAKVQGRIERRGAIVNRIAQGKPSRGASKPSEVEVTEKEETVTIHTDPSATNVDLPNRNNEMPNMEAVREIAEEGERQERGNSEENRNDEGQREESGAENEGGEGENADGGEYNADGDDNADGEYNADGEEEESAEMAAIEDDNFLSAAGRIRAKRDEKHKAKMARKAAKTSKIEAKGEAKTTKAQAKLTKAEQGGGKIGDTLKAGLDLLKKDTSAPASEGDNAASDKPGMNPMLKTGLIIGGVVVAVGLVFAVAKMGKAKKAA